ncbi:MAG TPA: glutamine synthetase family protein [Candidatus Competibacteraceae bacterium]|nr:glutamine synthetase family protein [Candidatus Competibacteraceae bacterium]
MVNRAQVEEAEQFLREHPEIGSIDLLIADINGVIRGKRISRQTLHKVYKDGVCLPGSLFAVNIMGETVEETGLGFDEGDADRICWPVPGSLRPIPWQPRPMAQLLLGMYEEDGRPFYADPRHVLTRVAERFTRELRLTPVVAVEMEFYLIDQARDARGRPQPPLSPKTGERESKTQVYGVDELDDYTELLEAIAAAAALQGIPADTAVAEYAPGQYEINLKHEPDALAACDHAVMLKRLIKAVALDRRMEATFMAKLYADQAGSGMHVHISLLDEQGRNVFRARDGRDSPELLAAIGGLLELMPESMALFAPNANSYRRFQPGAFVPLTPTWGYNNRTTALRIPAGPEEATRIEHRVAGADANPYLLVAALLAGMHHGISRRSDPPPVVTGNAYAQFPRSLPSTWDAALDAFQRSSVLKEYLGADFCRVYHANKLSERNEFVRYVTPLELEWYLRPV